MTSYAHTYLEIKAQAVIDSFKRLGKAECVVDSLESRRDCERAMTALEEVLGRNDRHVLMADPFQLTVPQADVFYRHARYGVTDSHKIQLLNLNHALARAQQHED